MELLDALQPFVNLGTGPIEIVTGIFTRISALVFFLPAMGERTVNPRIRLGAAMAIAVMLTPVVMAHNPVAPTTLSGLVVTMGAEALSGALIGFSIRVVMFVLQMAGSIAAQHTSLAQLFGGERARGVEQRRGERHQPLELVHRAPALQRGDQLLDPLVAGLERVLAQHGALRLVVELQVDPVHRVVPLALLGAADELAPQASPGGLRR